jgi:hypothetical protein
MLLACLADPAAKPEPSAEPTETPKGAPPQLIVVTSVGKRRFQATKVEYVPVTKTVVVKANEGGVEVVKTVNVTEMVAVTKTVEHDFSKANISTAGGKKLTAEELAKRLTKPTPIVLVTGAELDPAWRAMFKPNTLIVAIAVPAAPVPVVPAPAK